MFKIKYILNCVYALHFKPEKEGANMLKIYIENEDMLKLIDLYTFILCLVIIMATVISKKSLYLH